MRIRELRKLSDDTYVLYRNKWVCKVKIYEGRWYLLSNLYSLSGSYPDAIVTDEFKYGWFLCSSHGVDDCLIHKRLKLFGKEGRRLL